jgi:hypothetical protein
MSVRALVGAALRRAFLAAGRRAAAFFLAFGATLRAVFALGFRVAFRAGFFAALDFAAFFFLIAI